MILKVPGLLQYISCGYGIDLELVKSFQVRLLPSCFDRADSSYGNSRQAGDELKKLCGLS